MGEKLKGGERGRMRKVAKKICTYSWVWQIGDPGFFYASQDDCSSSLNDTHLSPVGSLSLKHPGKLWNRQTWSSTFSARIHNNNSNFIPIMNKFQVVFGITFNRWAPLNVTLVRPGLCSLGFFPDFHGCPQMQMSSCESMCVATGVSWSICPHPTQGLWAADTHTQQHTHTFSMFFFFLIIFRTVFDIIHLTDLYRNPDHFNLSSNLNFNLHSSLTSNLKPGQSTNSTLNLWRPVKMSSLPKYVLT